MILVYSVAPLGELSLNECTIRAARSGVLSWWQLWTWVERDDGGGPFHVSVPVHLAPYTDHGPGGRKTWGLSRVSDAVWQVVPSIDVLGDELPDGQRKKSPWHQTPTIVSVPTDQRWMTGGP